MWRLRPWLPPRHIQAAGRRLVSAALRHTRASRGAAGGVLPRAHPAERDPLGDVGSQQVGGIGIRACKLGGTAAGGPE